jgi:macrolide-specific efflux system membrane fusion protein
MQKKHIFILGILVILCAASFWGYKAIKGHEQKKEAKLSRIVTVEKGNIENVVTALGKLEPKDSVDVGAQVSGSIIKMHYEVGDKVSEGDLIAEIDPAVYEAQLKATEARLKTMGAQRAEQTALIEQAQSKYDRNARLIKEKAISVETLDDAKTTLEIAKARLQSLDAQLEEVESTRAENIANLGYTKIFAPMDGTIVNQLVKVGQTINANQTAPIIVQIANLKVMTIKAQVAEADIAHIKDDMKVHFTTLGSQGRRWEGIVRQILPTPETVNDVVLYNVLVDVDNSDHQLMTGMTTQMFFVIDSVMDTITVPLSVLTTRAPEKDKDNAQAYIIKKANGQDVVVLIGARDRTKAQVIEGLTAGERIEDGTSLRSSAVSSQASARPSAGPRMGGGMGRL